MATARKKSGDQTVPALSILDQIPPAIGRVNLDSA
jgi:hypothetical protein